MACDDLPPDSQPGEIGVRSAFENLVTNIPAVLDSLVAQLPTESVLALYHTSSHLQNFLKDSPTAWRYISWRLYQPALQTATPTNSATNAAVRQPSNYALDQVLLYIINPFSTCLVSLELDNTSVSGATLFQSVMVLRKDTLQHVSVRGCKNVSLKYHINPWLTMHAMALDRKEEDRAPGYEKLALKSLYTYRCRHHRRRPYLPSSLARKESDSEPTHELVSTCHKLGIWTDTAWCTTPGARCFRRRGYVTMRVPQDPREVWVVFDRLWRSRNWLGPIPDRAQPVTSSSKKRRKDDCRSWEVEEEAMNGEPIGINGEGKEMPAHLRKTHKQFVEDIYCENCSTPVLERCEQCSVMMHCTGCRKTLCSSCAFDRPYLRNRMATEEDKNKFWWAPGCAVSPCSMQDQDLPAPGPGGNPAPNPPGSLLPTIKFKWCCTEPVFSGGGGITFGNGSSRETDRIRAAPLNAGEDWEDPEFSPHAHIPSGTTTPLLAFTQIGSPLSRSDGHGPGGRWPSIDGLFQPDPIIDSQSNLASVPRILCDECHSSEQWKIRCKACAISLCLKHDVKERLKVRICGYKDLPVEKSEWKSRQKALKLIAMLMLRRRLKGKLKAAEERLNLAKESASKTSESTTPKAQFSLDESQLSDTGSGIQTPRPLGSAGPSTLNPTILVDLVASRRNQLAEIDPVLRPLSPGSNSTGPPSRASSPTPSAQSLPVTPETSNVLRRTEPIPAPNPLWRGCQSFFCPSTRTPGDHRRRCIATMRQCAECKVHVCEQCLTGLEPSCPCKGCRAPSNEQVTMAEMLADGNTRFFCPNCRWTRMKTGKCKVKVMTKVMPPKNGRKLRKPVGERKFPQLDLDDAVDGLADFFEVMEAERREANVNFEQAATVWDVPAVMTTEGNPEEIRQLEDMGALARDLIRRIQTLRQQFGPHSLAALALPHITMEEPRLASSQVTTNTTSDVQPQVQINGQHQTAANLLSLVTNGQNQVSTTTDVVSPGASSSGAGA